MFDFRSDTVTQPSSSMRQAMQRAEVGDDVYREDPSVNALEEKLADMAGLEAALLVPSGTQSNLVALLTHCGRGEEYLVGQEYHTYFYEGGGAAALGGIVPQPIAVEDDGTLDLALVQRRIKPKDEHFARSKLLALENTHSGKVISQNYLTDARNLARSANLSTHLDGARVFNAVVHQGLALADICSEFDSVSICFSKGLGAPVGSLLCGSQAFIEEARRWRKMLGGGLRQSGVLAAAIDYALDNHIDDLAIDHDNAKALQEGLEEIDELNVETANTNMLYMGFADEATAKGVASFLRDKGFVIAQGQRVRLVTHRDIPKDAINQLIGHLKSYFQ